MLRDYVTNAIKEYESWWFGCYRIEASYHWVMLVRGTFLRAMDVNYMRGSGGRKIGTSKKEETKRER
jgi:hypothetical protein